MAESCPICSRPSAAGRLHPFCSRRCADADLGRWFTGAYVVPSAEGDDAAAEGDDAAAGDAATRG